MPYEFTPAAERALTAAAAWSSDDASDDLAPPELLLGLLDEPECRAALVLSQHGLDAAAVRQRWPALRPAPLAPAERMARPNAELRAALSAAAARLHEYPLPLTLATEHLLLGLTEGPGEVACWLRAAGLDPDALEADVHRWAGHLPGPLPSDFDLPSHPAAHPAAASPGPLPAARATAAWRALDAAANRAGEGLRVAEDYARFALDDRHLTERCKSLRHRLAELLGQLPRELRLASRDTLHDVGAAVALDSEATRRTAADVAAAAWQRVAQSLRSLEEFGKLHSSEWARACEALRYEAYTLERSVHLAGANQGRLAGVRLYVLVDGRPTAAEFDALVAELVAEGVHALQLRDKRLSDRELLVRARALIARTAGTSTLAIVNDRPDLALLAGADGVHVGQDELPVKDARSVLGPGGLVGVSTHSLDQARQAVLDGADYLGLGPTFPSRTKEFSRFAGLELLRTAAAEVSLPSFAIGGIQADNLDLVLATGVSRVAVGSAVVDATRPAAAAAELLRRLSGPA